MRGRDLDNVGMEVLYSASLGMSQALDAANKCRLLPPKPQHAKLLHTASRLHLASDEVQFLLDAESEMSIVAVKGAALSHNCRNLVSELGGARIIRHGGPDQLTPFAALRLRAAYGADTPIEEVEPDAQAIDNLRAATDGDRCEVVFARRGKRQRAAEYAAAALRRASRLPVLGGALRGATDLAARTGVAQLTPTNRPTFTLRVLKKLPWRVQRLGARLWLQGMLHIGDSRRRSLGSAEAHAADRLCSPNVDCTNPSNAHATTMRRGDRRG